MPSSTFSSDALRAITARHALPAGLRLTAADRPGIAQPVPVRDVPDQPWVALAVTVLLLTLLLSALWEWQLRRLGLTPGDLGDSASAWAEQRHRLDAEPFQVAIVGDSRILFDTDLDRFRQLTGTRPLQLALAGTNGRPFLEDLAEHSRFAGLVVVGINDVSYFRERIGLFRAALDHARWESPADRASFVLRRQLARHLALPDNEYRLSTLLTRLDPGLRPGVDGPYGDVWKVAQFGEQRQAWLWPRLEHDAFLRDHARAVWHDDSPPVSPAVVAMTDQRTRAAVATIRARGGDVVFVRPPSAPELRHDEDRRLPRSKGWDALLAAADVRGLHADALPTAVQDLTLPEWSHLSRGCATVFTDSYVRWLVTATPKLRLVADAPAALTRADCTASATAP